MAAGLLPLNGEVLIEAGKLADFVVVDGDPLSNIRDAWNILIVFKNGSRYNISELLKTK